jgi:RNA polymerase sigma-70 factor (ECF subfamily)
MLFYSTGRIPTFAEKQACRKQPVMSADCFLHKMMQTIFGETRDFNIKKIPNVLLLCIFAPMDYRDKEKIWLEKLAEGDTDAFRNLFLAYCPKVKLFITQLVKSEAVAEDLSQDIFERIWLNREYLTNLKSFNAYVYRMAKNVAINYLEHQLTVQKYNHAYKPAPESSLEEEIEARELELIIQLAIEGMPEQRRTVFEMSRMKQLKNNEIADLLRISKKTVENHLNLALRQIRNATGMA